MSLGKDGQLHSVGDASNVGSPVQVGCPVLPRADADMLLKVLSLIYLELSKFILKVPQFPCLFL